MYRSGLADSRQCNCGLGVEDAFYFFKCPAHDAKRSRLFSKIQEMALHETFHHLKLTSVMFVLSPGRYDNFTQEQCEDILKATFKFIQLSERRL